MSENRLMIRRARLMGSAATALAGFALGIAPLAAQAADEADSGGGLEQVQESQPRQLAQAQPGPQLQQQAADEIRDLEEIVVTGSRIRRTELQSVSPVTTLGAIDIDTRGVLRVEDELNTLPSVVGSQTNNQSHGNSGTATIDLRGLGANRTLVLKDGKRMPFGSPQAVATDVNQIPSQLVERIEVLTGGASAVYGADAVAGVVNFVMKRDFEGLEADFQGSFFQSANDSSLIEPVLADFLQPDPGSKTDGRSLQATIVMGTNFNDDRGNVTAWFTYANDNPVRERDRDISSCALGTRNQGTEFACVGSSSAAPGRFIGFGDIPFDITLDPAGTFEADFDGEGGPLPTQTFQGVRQFDGLRDTFNFQGFGFFQRPTERFTFGASGHYEVVPDHEFFLDFSFIDNSTAANIAPSANFFRSVEVNCDNPLFSADQAALFCAENIPAFDKDGNPIIDEDTGVQKLLSNTDIRPDGVKVGLVTIGRRNVEGGPRHEDIDIQTFRVVGGFRGSFLDNFEYEVFGQFAKTDFSALNTDLNRDRITQALDVIEDPETGEIRCRDTSGGCVPWDIFGFNASGTPISFPGVANPFPSNVSQEAVDFLLVPVQTQGETKQTVFGGNVSGDLTPYGIKSPFANNGIQAVLGFEYRRDQLENVPDLAGQIPLAAGFGGPIDPVAGKVTVYEFFGEMQVPLVEDVFLIEELTANAAYRFSDYTVTTGTGNTYTGGLSWQITPDIRARAQYARAVRAPNPQELFLPQSNGLFDISSGPNGLFDPCAGDFDPNTPTPEPARTFEECARSGVTADQFGSIPDNPAGQLNSFNGGNPDLDPEKANTWTAGAIITPRFAPGLTLTVDWWTIKVKKIIGIIAEDLILDGCLDSGNPFLCDAVVRDEVRGDLFIEEDSFIRSTNINLGRIRTQGVDADVNYDFNLEDVGLNNAGSLNFRFIGTWLDKFTVNSLPFEERNAPELAAVLPAAAKTECAGTFGPGGTTCGRVRPEFRWRFSTTWRTPWELDITTTWRYFDSVKLSGGGAPVNSKLSSTSFIDLSFNYQVMDNVNLRAGVNNLADKDPPLSSVVGAGAGEGNTFPGIFDARGRFFFAGMNVSF